MSKEIEIGEYVKTKKGFIGKLINIDTKNEAYYLDCGKCVSLVNIIKHSKKIIDLIEEGDYVNGYKVKEVKESEIKEYRGKEGLPNLECYYEEWNGVFYLDIIKIKSILTKEQYEQNCYKLKE